MIIATRSVPRAQYKVKLHSSRCAAVREPFWERSFLGQVSIQEIVVINRIYGTVQVEIKICISFTTICDPSNVTKLVAHHFSSVIAKIVVKVFDEEVVCVPYPVSV